MEEETSCWSWRRERERAHVGERRLLGGDVLGPYLEKQRLHLRLRQPWVAEVVDHLLRRERGRLRGGGCGSLSGFNPSRHLQAARACASATAALALCPLRASAESGAAKEASVSEARAVLVEASSAAALHTPTGLAAHAPALRRCDARCTTAAPRRLPIAVCI